MDREKRIIEEVEKTLNVYENIEDINPNPYMITRIKSRLAEGKDKSSAKFSVFTTAKPVFIVLLVLFNIYSVVDLYVSKENNDEAKSEYIEAIGDEYRLNNASYYTYNIN